jgi:hypothetical protein
VVGLVEDLLDVCQDGGLQLDWHGGQCRILSVGSTPEEAIEVPLPKSVFRALLARLAALCNERTPGSVSPYGGHGELVIGTEPPRTYTVALTNTPDEQKVQLAGNAKHDAPGPRSSPATQGWDGVSGRDGPPGHLEVRSMG